MAVLSHLGPTRQDRAAVAWTLVATARLTGLAMLVPAVVGLVIGELTTATGLVVASAATVVVTAPLRARLRPPRGVTWSQAFTAAGLGWLVATGVAALPLLLSPNYTRPAHAFVEAMAGLTTTGLTFVSDLDHLPVSLNLWRHLLHPLGAIAALVVVATVRLHGDVFMATSTVAEAGEHRILPRRGRSLREATSLVVAWSAVGTVALTAALLVAGASVDRALLHAVTLATSAFSTGGFTVTSGSVWTWHSVTVQVVLAILMIGGATSLVLHRAVRARRLRDLSKELDVRVWLLSLAGLGTVVMLGLGRAAVHSDVVALVRRGFFMTVAAHTTTGLTAVPDRLIASGWGDLAPAALVAAMGIGAMSGSIGGGVGTLRVGLIAKGVVRDVRRLLLPESAMVLEHYQQRRRHVLGDQHVRASATVLLLVLASVFAGATVKLATSAEGGLPEAIFAATSAVSTTGLSLGFLGPETPLPTLLTSGLLMWFGRLEFLAVLAGIGLLARGLPGVGGHR